MDLETLWTMDKRPSVVFSRDPVEYEANFVKMLEKYPCPPDYIKDATRVKEENDFMGKL